MNESEALAVIQLLAEGIDPISFETLPNESTYNNPIVIRALYTAVQALEKRAKVQKRIDNLPQNAGKPWDENEDRDLLKEYNSGKNLKELAELHQRTSGAIRSRLLKHQIIIEATIGESNGTQ